MARGRDDDDDEDQPDAPDKPAMSKAEARSLLVVPGVALQVIGIACIVAILWSCIYPIGTLIHHLTKAPRAPTEDLVKDGLAIALNCFLFMIHAAIVCLASSVKNASSYSFALGCVILAVVCGLSPCYLHYLAFAILAFVLMMKADVRRSFRD